MAISVKFKEYELLDGSKKKMLEKVNQGKIITRFEKTPIPREKTDVVCPHFVELKWAYGCPHDCAWCYLWGTFGRYTGNHNPVVKDPKLVRDHLATFLSSMGGPAEILNSGELADSLMTETTDEPFSKMVMPMVMGSRHKVLFLSKKGPEHIKHFLENQWQKNAIMSFSLNAFDVAERWERIAPHPRERIEAARQLSEAGYEVRVRIDPIVAVPEWENSYKILVDYIFKRFRPERVTMGTLRGLSTVVRACQDKSWVEYLDDKTNFGRRINLALRVRIYKTLMEKMATDYDFRNVALCKETVETHKLVGNLTGSKLKELRLRCNCTW